MRRLARDRLQNAREERFGKLNALFTRLDIYSSILQSGDLSVLTNHRSVQLEIDAHYRNESEKILTFARTYQIETSEKARIYHHSLIKRNNKRSSILKLDTPVGRITGHSACFNYLEADVIKLLSSEHPSHPVAKNHLLNFIEPVFTERDNDML